MDALYQQQILALAKNMRDSVLVVQPTHAALVSNPTCGDRVNMTLQAQHHNTDNLVITAAGAEVRGCALCEAGAGLFLNIANGLTSADAAALHSAFAAWLAGDDDAAIHKRMEMFQPVRSIKGRHKCVTLAFDAAVKALHQPDSPASTG